LYRRYRERGFSVLGFPCNQFGRQEPGSDDEIHRFCEVTYGVTFPIFRKIEVNGPGADPLYRYLKSQRKGRFRASRVSWNFTKFLVGRDGRPVARFGSRVTPAALEPAVMQALEA
jgi:glutathione peroxidase